MSQRTEDEESPLLGERTEDARAYGTGDPADEEVLAGKDDTPKTSPIYVVIPMSIGIFLAAMDGTIIAASYAKIGSDLNHLQNTSWIATGYMLMLTSFQPLYGKLSDIFGRRGCLVFSYAVFALGCLFCGLARNMTELVAARALAGIGGGGMSTVASIVMSDVVPLRERGTWQGITNIVWATGQAVGAPLGGYLADTIGWRWSFLLQVPLALAAIISVSLALKLPRRETEHFLAKLKRIDFAGAIALVVGVFCLLVGLDRGGNVSWTDRVTVGCLSTFCILFVLFGFIELKVASEPFAPKAIVASPALVASYLANFFGAGTTVALTFMVTLYFQAVKGRTASEAGLVLLSAVPFGVGGSLFGGILMQKTGKYYWLTVITFSMMVFGQVLVTGLSGTWTYTYVGIAIGLCFSSFGVGTGVTTTLISLIANAGPENQAVATAVSYLFRSLGTVVTLSISTTVMQDTLRQFLYQRLTGENVDEIIRRVRESLTYIGELEPHVREKVILSYQDAIHISMWFICGVSVCAVVSACFIKEVPLSKK